MPRTKGAAEESVGWMAIGALSKATGVPVETLRTWERRYGFPEPQRTPSGHRLYAVSAVPRIRRVAEALAMGHRAGQVLTASDAELDRLLQTLGTPPDRPLPAGFPAPAAEGSSEALQAILNLDGTALTRHLLGQYALRGPIEFVVECVTPLLDSLGGLWAEGEVQIRHEHLASQRIEDLLRSIRLPFEEKASGPLVVLATLSGEEHGLGMHMAALVLAYSGCRTLCLGVDSPVAEIAHAAKERNARAVALSISSAGRGGATTSSVRRLRQALPRRTYLVLGGSGASLLSGTILIQDLRLLARWAADLAEASRQA